MSPRLVLWDIDQTLVNMDKAGERALLVLIKEKFQRDLGGKLPVDLRGRTDTSIVHDLLTYLDLEVSPKAAQEFRDGYLALLPKTMPAGNARVLPGIKAALEAIKAHPELHQALLTGN